MKRAYRQPCPRSGRAGRRRGQRGQSATEFIIALPVLLLLCLGLIQFALLYQAKSTVNYATLMAARAGAVENGQKTAMLNGFGRGIAPLFAHSTGLATQQMAVATATIEARNPGITTLAVISPTGAALSDFGRANYYAGKTVTEIPNDTLMYRNTQTGSSSGLSIQDANLLKISVTYCYDLYVPFINRVIFYLVNGISNIYSTGNSGGLGLPTKMNGCYGYSAISGDFRIPIESEAIVRMQSPYRGG
ncbi:TadE/TadG family type IV pilus assembly protein [Paraburkholderia sp. J12]|uniref:TadE/TadG family type IV pilus assembly protein n=1 Tax=Paraburkholderia sp. J12 TaxID=2805432 RepID=UPI002ABDB294|nr:TadE/TadG family type IV pilus assembly protein [Paraburkholderia sp. J12]